MAAEIPKLGELVAVAPLAGFRAIGGRIPRQSHRYSGRTAMHADISVHEPKPPEDIDAPLAFSMEGHDGPPPPALDFTLLGAGLEFGAGTQQVPK